MRRKRRDLRFALVVLTLLLSGLFWWIYSSSDMQQQSSDTLTEGDKNSEDDVVNPENTDDSENEVGTYTTYSPTKLKANVTNVLFFYADWCPSCRGFDSDLVLNINRIPKDLNILRVDYDTETKLKKKYSVTLQHTLILVDEKGELLEKFDGLYSILTLDEIIEALKE
ncbi:thioredoxin family protein [Candidatus Dojkabacteria bacterium]|nr:thioredoxin family protein [Candidatus Dojkabacteria bacterium]